jgi:hypothetical protein
VSAELVHGGGGHVVAEKRQTTVYTFTGAAEPPPVKPPPNPRHLSGEDGHRTPPDIVERARLVLGGIDLDPFSSAEANRTIGAREFFSGPHFGANGTSPLDAVDGFEENWQGRVFCNPPGGRGPKNASNQKRAWFKLAEDYMDCGVTSALFVCFSVELLQTTQVKTPDGLLIPLDFPICFPRRRVAYLTPDGRRSKSPPHASCFVLLPDRERRVEVVSAFIREFSPVGRVVVPATWGVVS